MNESNLLPMVIYGADRVLRTYDGKLDGALSKGGFKTVIDGVEMVSVGILRRGFPNHILLMPIDLFPPELWADCVWVSATPPESTQTE